MSPEEDKAFATLQAEFALRGHVLNRTPVPNGTHSYFATRWGMARHLADLGAVGAFLKQIGGGEKVEVQSDGI
ncbi:hypothetical protein [Rhodoferax sp. GW822-FHT02A01]|uniref:hypothetical protein n=1 Tax=Rhodoferax sp. GW822-FHT02A01 TaxID=3141537 RepID=UPI00315DEA7B